MLDTKEYILTKNIFKVENLNPLSKIIILTLISIIGSIDFFPFTSIILIIIAFIISEKYSNIGYKELFNSIKSFFVISLGYIFTIVIANKLAGNDINYLVSISLATRILLFGVYTSIFVKTTDPVEFVMSLIKYFKMPVKMGFAFLTAYRFLPTFKNELEIIKYAHQVRNVEDSKILFFRIFQSKRYIIPMMATAIRKGIRISMAMETRAFGKYKTRVYYRELNLSKMDYMTIVSTVVCLIGLILCLNAYNLINIGIVFKG